MSYIEDTKTTNFRYEFLLSIEKSAKRFWKSATIISFSLLTILSIFFLTNYLTRETDQQIVTVSEIEQINSVLRFLVNKVKAQEAEALEKPQPKTTNQKVLSVIVPKANIREAPGFKSRKIMEVGEGIRLLHSKTDGLWHEVFTPHGVKAWVYDEVVSF